MNDSELLDWMTEEFIKSGHLNFTNDTAGKYGVNLFTVSSQHVTHRGNDCIRKVIENAAQRAKERKTEIRY